MTEQTVVVWDLETIPDLAAAARMLDLGAAPEAKVREALGSGFPKHPLHKIVALAPWSRAANLRAGASTHSARRTLASEPRQS
jgi:predicted PolB exonuclease-like 3'-5' exonuclease